MRVGSNNDVSHEETINTAPGFNRNSYGSKNGYANQPPSLIEEWDNLKQVSDQKVLQPFFLKGIQQYYQNRLDKANIDSLQQNPKIVFVKEVTPELIISDGEQLMAWKIDYAILRDSGMNLDDLKGKYLKLNDWNFTVKMESMTADNQDYTKVLISVIKYQYAQDMTLCSKKYLRLQKSVYTTDAVKNLVRYTRHRLIKLAAREIDSADIEMPSMSEICGKQRKPVKPIQSIIKVNHDKINRQVTKISGFKDIPDVDFEAEIAKLPSLDYSSCQEVALQVKLTEEEKHFNSKLNKVPNGNELVDLMMELRENNLDENEDFLQQNKPSLTSKVQNEESMANLEEDKENKVKPNVLIDGYELDELEDWVDSDTEFKPKGDTSASKSILNTKEVLAKHEEVMNSIPQRHADRQAEKRQMLKEKFTDGMTKIQWEGFKNWVGKSKP